MALEENHGYENGDAFAADVIKVLKTTPLNLTKPVPLSFFLYIPNEITARKASSELVECGFEVDVEESAQNDGNWLCWCDKLVDISFESLKEIGNKFLALAETYNGEFDGWETNRYVDHNLK